MIAAKIEQALQDGQDYSYEHRMRTADGRWIWLHVSNSVVPDDAGEPALIRTVSLDITAQKEAEAERERSHSLLQATLDASADAIFVADLAGKVTASNRAWLELWQIPQSLIDSVDHKAVIDHVAGRVADPDEFRRREAEITGQDRAIATQDVFELVDGRTIERHTMPQRLGGEIVGRVWSFRDITEKLAAQRALQRFGPAPPRGARETSPLIAAAIDAHGTTTFANDALLKLTGWSREEVDRQRLVRSLRRQSRTSAPTYFERLETGEIRPHFESTIRTRSGERRDIRWSSTIQHDESGAVAGIITIGEDVTERNRADALLRSREQLFRSLIENASEVITILSVDGTSLFESPSVERVLGRKPEELVGMPSFALLHEDDVEHVQKTFAAILAGEEVGADGVQAAPPRRLLAHGRGDRAPAPPGRRVGRRRQLPRRHRRAPAAGAAAALAEARGGWTARGRNRARLQQPADRDRRLQPVSRCRLRRRRPAPRGRARDRARVRSRGRAHGPAARLQPPSGAAGGGARPGRGRRRAREPALAAPRRGRRAVDVRRAGLPRARRPGTARAGDHESGAQRPRRDALGRLGRARRAAASTARSS